MPIEIPAWYRNVRDLFCKPPLRVHIGCAIGDHQNCDGRAGGVWPEPCECLCHKALAAYDAAIEHSAALEAAEAAREYLKKRDANPGEWGLDVGAARDIMRKAIAAYDAAKEK